MTKAATKGASSGNDGAPPVCLSVRRTQAERSAAMKQRLIDATLDALVDVGYAELTFSHVVQRAGVSRGAPLHHFASKAALVEAAAEALVQQWSDRVAESWQTAKSSPDPIRTFCFTLWRESINTRQGAMFAELNHASRHSTELSVIVSRLWTEVYHTLTEIAGEDAREGTHLSAEVSMPIGRVMMMSQWFMRGMAADVHLGAAEGLFEAYLENWIKMLKTK